MGNDCTATSKGKSWAGLLFVFTVPNDNINGPINLAPREKLKPPNFYRGQEYNMKVCFSLSPRRMEWLCLMPVRKSGVLLDAQNISKYWNIINF